MTSYREFASVVMGPVVVAIPVRNEVDRIEPCLAALAGQSEAPDMSFSSSIIATTEAKPGPRKFLLEMISVQLAPKQANAGTARRLAMRHASNIAENRGALLTTDADAVVAHDWVSRNIASLTGGADAVCGRIVVDPVEALAIPAHLHADDLLERELLDLLDEITFALDPVSA